MSGARGTRRGPNNPRPRQANPREEWFNDMLDRAALAKGLETATDLAPEIRARVEAEIAAIDAKWGKQGQP